MGFWSTLGDIGRGVAAVGTLGASEAVIGALSPSEEEKAQQRQQQREMDVNRLDVQLGAKHLREAADAGNAAVNDRLAMADRQAAALQAQQAHQAGRTALGQAAQVGPVNIDQSQQAQFRNAQLANLAQLQAQANGTGPSLAQQQLRMATDRNMQQALAQQAAMRGRAGGMAGARSLADARAGISQEAAGQSSLMRLQEQMAAQQAIAGLAGQGRAQDIGLATNQAGLNMQGALANQAANNQFGLAQGSLDQQRELANLQARAALQGQQNQLGFGYAGMGINTAEGNRAATMGAEQAGINANLGLAGGAQQYQEYLMSRDPTFLQYLQALGGPVATGVGAGIALSDERQKEDIEDGSAASRRILSALGGSKAYRYKDPSVPGASEGPQLGVMAQDLERTPEGKALIIDTPHGKVVDYGRGLGMMMANQADLHRRLEALEALGIGGNKRKG